MPWGVLRGLFSLARFFSAFRPGEVCSRGEARGFEDRAVGPYGPYAPTRGSVKKQGGDMSVVPRRVPRLTGSQSRRSGCLLFLFRFP